MTEAVRINDGERKSAGRAADDIDFTVQEVAYAHPQDVVTDVSLSTSAKRAILASWASDACAVDGMPAYRELPGTGHIVSVDAILEALRALDGSDLH